MRRVLFQQYIDHSGYARQLAEAFVVQWSNSRGGRLLLDRGASVWWRTTQVNGRIRVQVIGDISEQLMTLYLLAK